MMKKSFPEGFVRSDRIKAIVREAASLAHFEAEELARDGYAEDAAEAAERRRFYQHWLDQAQCLTLPLHPLLAAAIADHASPTLDASLIDQARSVMAALDSSPVQVAA